MITFEYINIPAPVALQDFQDALAQYGSTGWRFVLVYNNYIFFEREIETKYR